MYPFSYGTIVMEYEYEVLYKLRSTPEEKEITPEIMRDRSEFSDGVYRQVQEFLTGERKSFDVIYSLNGTEFQRKVWATLCKIPYGETRSYKQIAEALGQPKAVRAVGMANNRNPLMIIVPCHRVIGSDGSLVGYAGGLEMKKALLEVEQCGR